MDAMDIIQERDDDCSADSFRDEAEYKQKETNDAFAAQETANVKRLKLFLLSVLICATLTVSLGAYFYVDRTEHQEFEDQFHDGSRKVLSALGVGLETTMSGIDGFAVSIISQARDSNQTWPFVVVPDYAARAGRVRNTAHLLFLGLVTKVEIEELQLWHQFTAQTGRDWVDNALDVQENDPSYFGPVVRNYTTVDFIMAGAPGQEVEIKTGRRSKEYLLGIFSLRFEKQEPYLPTWHYYPVITLYPPYNLDLSRHPLGHYQYLLSSLRVLLTAPFLTTIPDWYRQFLTPEEDPMEPISRIIYPLFRHMADSMRSLGNEPESNKASDIVGLLETHIYWRDWIRDILPGGSNGIVLVFESQCNSTFSYELHGPKPVFLGMGDFHDPKYDYMEVSSDLYSLRDFFSKSRYYAGVPLDEAYCPMTVKVYASDTMKSKFVTSNSILFSLAAAFIFIFTASIFVLYDLWVERRQNVVMTKAVTSTAIVSSLFPENVRDRVFPQQNNPASVQYTDSFNKNARGEESESAPIADLFPAATVFFADIAGFTKWSSERSPSDVFLLLETLYAAFDEIAVKRNVFKIETIGDCYMAVTGVPKAQPKHALIMCKFAADCREKMNELTTSDLSAKLGLGTADLKLRIGLHSGPVTAGVLRGQKARFQLFGDTVNTASRCESTGSPNRIHVSEQTAKLIMDAGYGVWLSKRKDLAEAKGKGAMQTYWVEPRVGTKSCRSTTSRPSSDSDAKEGDDDDDLLVSDDNNKDFERSGIIVQPLEEGDDIGDKLVNYLSKTTLKRKVSDNDDIENS